MSDQSKLIFFPFVAAVTAFSGAVAHPNELWKPITDFCWLSENNKIADLWWLMEICSGNK